ncbi:MAG: DivIVA domain-containing protein [Fretibacterium sp.]|nr:DivIVA domain-containing protein [Fretibacterium sp.]
MTELLTAKDVEEKVFKKVSFGGYSVPEVEDFLNQVADDLEEYALRLNARENRIHELEEHIKKQESMTDMIKDALIQARKSAREMEEQARDQTAKVLAEAEKSAAEIVSKARMSADDILKDSREKSLEAEQRWSSLEQDLESHRKDANEQVEQTLAEARIEARHLIEEASREVNDYENRLRLLNLKKQQFLKDTVALLLDFGRIIDQAQQEIEVEMGREEDDDSSGDQGTSPRLIERFRRNLLEGKEIVQQSTDDTQS